MRPLLFVVIVIAACGSSKPTGPAWPKMAETDPKDDGGESIAPRESNSVAAVVEKSEEPEAKKADVASAPAATPTPSPPSGDEKPAAPTTTASPDDVINTEEIVIEIEDDD